MLPSLHPEDGGSMFLRNLGILPHRYTESQPKRPRLESSRPWKPQISYSLFYMMFKDLRAISKEFHLFSHKPVKSVFSESRKTTDFPVTRVTFPWKYHTCIKTFSWKLLVGLKRARCPARTLQISVTNCEWSRFLVKKFSPPYEARRFSAVFTGDSR
jgi:hypothetical protein